MWNVCPPTGRFLPASPRQRYRLTTRETGQLMSLSREFAAFVADLRYEDLPPAVVDRAKGVTLEALSSALVAHAMPAGRQALALMLEEEAGAGGAATVLCSGAKLTKSCTATATTEIIFAGGKWDNFRMLTHPGTAILPAALAAAEAAG